MPHGEGRRPAPLLLLCLIALRPFSFSELVLWPLNPTGSWVFSPMAVLINAARSPGDCYLLNRGRRFSQLSGSLAVIQPHLFAPRLAEPGQPS